MTDREALQIAWNALVAIDANTPYPVAKHALWAINAAFNTRQEECNTHPDAPHGYNREASTNEHRYVCICESWEQGESDGQ